ncbi:hypothetical protein [Romboutsia sp.]|uniref:hypothetical protein n=1 Tax=Romboutsia sp. TaxID=1965302 RepID=UPI002BFA0794|nr:hypothetical protein [Romboutsia sp.]HSQ88706.1 hypothetical protein [Romboutsia sp.]
MKVNSWGRKIKDIISLTFKKDEEDIKLFLNEQSAPAAYIKELVRREMLNEGNEPTQTKTSTVIEEDPAENFDFGSLEEK